MKKKRGSAGKSKLRETAGEIDEARLEQVTGGGGGVPGVSAAPGGGGAVAKTVKLQGLADPPDPSKPQTIEPHTAQAIIGMGSSRERII
jgi:hypothetical protein